LSITIALLAAKIQKDFDNEKDLLIFFLEKVDAFRKRHYSKINDILGYRK
jgi:hypothetical protein